MLPAVLTKEPTYDFPVTAQEEWSWKTHALVLKGFHPEVTRVTWLLFHWPERVTWLTQGAGIYNPQWAQKKGERGFWCQVLG